MRLGWLLLPSLLAGCGSVGLDPYGESSEDQSDALDVQPSGPISFGNVSPYDEPHVETLTISTTVEETVAINEIGLSDTSSRAFGVDVPDDIFPLRLAGGDVFEFDVYFPSENYQDRDQTGSFSGQVVLYFQVGRDGAAVELSKTLTGTLCEDYRQDGTCG